MFPSNPTDTLLKTISEQNTKIQTILSRQAELLEEQLCVLKEIANGSDTDSMPSTIYSVISDHQETTLHVQIDTINKELSQVKRTLNELVVSKTQGKPIMPPMSQTTGKYQRFKVFGE